MWLVLVFCWCFVGCTHSSLVVLSHPRFCSSFCSFCSLSFCYLSVFLLFFCYMDLLPSLLPFLSPFLQCSTCSPGAPDPYRPTCQNRYNNTAAPWCFSYIYDPEGVLSTVPTVMSAWLGTHFGAYLCFLVVSYHQIYLYYIHGNILHI